MRFIQFLSPVRGCQLQYERGQDVGEKDQADTTLVNVVGTRDHDDKRRIV
jgi:hypothetical protein